MSKPIYQPTVYCQLTDSVTPLVIEQICCGWQTVSIAQSSRSGDKYLRSILVHCWLGDGKGIRPVKTWALIRWWCRRF